MNLPNKLTVARVGLTGVFVAALLLPPDGRFHAIFPYGKTLALAVFIVAGLTDWWDGVLARKHKLETNFGALLDPVADKILTTAAFICFIEMRAYAGNALVQGWMVLLIVSRDFLVTGLRLVAQERGVVLKAERLGKHKTISQMVTIIVTLIGLAARQDWGSLGVEPEMFDQMFSVAVFWLMMVTVGLTVISGFVYFWKNQEVFLRDA